MKGYKKAECMHKILITMVYCQTDSKIIHSTTSCLQMASLHSATVTAFHLTLKHKTKIYGLNLLVLCMPHNKDVRSYLSFTESIGHETFISILLSDSEGFSTA